MSEERTGNEQQSTESVEANEISDMLSESMREEKEETSEEQETPVHDKGDEEGDDPEGEEAEEESGEKADEELSELEKLRKQNQILKQQLQETPQQQEEEQKVESTPLSDEFLKDYNFEEIQDDPEKFKQFILDVANHVKKNTEESIFKNLPQTVNSLAGQQIELRQTAQRFYDQNPELAEVKPFVAKITNQVASEHPDWGIEKVLAETAKRSYKALGLEKTAKTQQQTSGKKRKPGLADAKGGSKRRNKSGEELSELEKEIQDILT